MVQISEKNLREMSAERDFNAGVQVSFRYCILSSPRSGSTLLGRVLHGTGKAGDPQEYFNPPLLQVERERSGQSDMGMNEFLRRMERRRTSPNGVFGMKMHYSQMLGAFRAKNPNENMLKMLRGFNALIWIRRRDRIGQGISQAIAMRTNVWSSEDGRFRRVESPQIHPFECLNAMRLVCHDDAGWERVLARARLPVLQVWYEDLVSDYESQVRRVLTHLSIADAVESIPDKPLERQAGALNDQLRSSTLNYLGINSGN
jgi:LPS sulfotransferase NodH